MKKITKTGEDFIRTICSGTSNSLISGSYNYNLPFSSLSNTPTVFTANAIDHVGNPIVTNSQLAESLIFWYNKYGESNDIDSNILAAQGFVESGYRLWHYDQFRSGSGISNFHSRRVYSHMVNANQPTTIESLQTDRLLSFEITGITNGLVEPNQPTSYKYGGYGLIDESIGVAITNKERLHQNLMDYPEYSIKTQAALFKELSLRNSGVTSIAIFSYSRDITIQETNYRVMLDNAGRKFDTDYVREGITYVKKVFGVLGDRDNDKQPKVEYKKPKGKYFGFDIQFKSDSFNSFLG